MVAAAVAAVRAVVAVVALRLEKVALFVVVIGCRCHCWRCCSCFSSCSCSSLLAMLLVLPAVLHCSWCCGTRIMGF